MNRAPNTNGHTAESVRARGGYDAYFTPVAEQSDDTAAPSAPDPASRGPRKSVPPFDPGSTVADAGPGNRQHHEWSAGATASISSASAPEPLEHAGPESARASSAANSAAPDSPVPGTTPAASVPADGSRTGSGATGADETGPSSHGEVSDTRRSAEAQGSSEAQRVAARSAAGDVPVPPAPQEGTTARPEPPRPDTGVAPAGTAAVHPGVGTAAPHVGGVSAGSAPGYSPPASARTAAAAAPATAGPAASGSAPMGNAAAQQNSWPTREVNGYAETVGAGRQSATHVDRSRWPAQHHVETVAATHQSTTPTGSVVPERLGTAEAAARVEVLPATLTSMDLLADITAARRAQLKSTSGMRGALNKVGFSLGLSPAEQRTEDRRARIRRQLDTPYQIAVVSVKGGVGRTTVAATLGSTFAALRPDRVVAVDANPDFGDLPARTAPHPFGLTVRDMAQTANLDAFSAVHSYTSVNNADLAVVASPWTTESVEALSGREYTTAVQTLRRHYNLVLVDCGTGVLDSITQAVLQTSDAVVVVTPATVGGVKGAVATLNWLNSHGLQHLIASSIVTIVHQHPVKPTVDVDQVERLFATAKRPTRLIPHDEHLGEGGEIDLRLLDKDTLLAFEELAADLGDGFPGFSGGVERGGRR